MFQTLTLKGLRGFATEQSVNFAQPNGAVGSGLTTIVGPNSGGKSTLLEALQAVAQEQLPSFSERKRNTAAGSRIRIVLRTGDGEFGIQTVKQGGSECELFGSRVRSKALYVRSRRVFAAQFSKTSWTREDYMTNEYLPPNRAPGGGHFHARLFKAASQLESFNKVWSQVAPAHLDWTIDSDETGQYFLKITETGGAHSSEGLGEGLLSLFFLVDALYDSKAGDTIVIDEPELSLHPAFQKRVMKLFMDFAKDRQIIYSTHSPYFVDFIPILNGAAVARVFKRGGECQIRQLTQETAKKLQGFLTDTHNPHVFGLNGREAFFLEDKIILVEGQDEVIHVPRIASQLGISLDGEFFGWGVGGASKMAVVCTMLKELGYSKIFGALDGDPEGADAHAKLTKEFPEFRFVCIPAEDIKSKEAKTLKATIGLLDGANKNLREEHKEAVTKIFGDVNAFFADSSS